MNFEAYVQLLRLHRPIPILLLLWPTYWALLMASHGLPEPRIFWIFTFGVLLMRAAGCVLNDIADRDFDRHVARTANRPITAGKISVTQALTLAIGLCLIAFILVLQLNHLTISLAFIALGLAAIYPLMKRFTYFPQAVLGAAFNFGIIMAFAAIQNRIPPVAWLLYIATLFWTVAYDTWYAMADREDDITIGIKSTARLFADAAPIWIGLCSALFLLILGLAGYLSGFSMSYYLILLLAIPLFIYEQCLGRRHAYIAAFSHNHWVGSVVLIAILLQYTRSLII